MAKSFIPPALLAPYQIARAIFDGVGEARLGLISAGVAFYGLLAIFPTITALISLWGIFADPAAVSDMMARYDQLIPAEALALLEAQITTIASGPSATLGWATVVSLSITLWLSRSGVSALLQGLNAVYREQVRSGFLTTLMALALTLILIFVALIAMGTAVLLPVVLSFVRLGGATSIMLEVFRLSITVTVVLFGVGLLYRFGPNRSGYRARWVTPGAVLALVLWVASSWGFSFYLSNFGRYNEVYGSLGAVVALLMWFYISAYVVLLGGLVNAVLERRAKQVSTLNKQAVQDHDDTPSGSADAQEAALAEQEARS